MKLNSDLLACTGAIQKQASDPQASAFVRANAGSGKTHVLTQRVLRLLLAGTPPAKILCLTFTKAAAANMDLKAAMAHTRKQMDPVFGHVFIYEHCLPFDVSRAFDEARGIKNPRIWTAERDQEMWASLQA